MLVDTPVVVNVDKHVMAERAAVEESVALMNMAKVGSWRAVTLGLGRCDHALQTAEADSIPHVKVCDYDGSCFRSNYPGAPWCEMCRTGFQVDMSSREPQLWAAPMQAGAYTLTLRTRARST